jgi:basic membrane protein A
MSGLVSLRAGKFVAVLAASSLVLGASALPARAALSIKIAIAYDIGGRGDHGINDYAAKGVDAIKKKFGLTALSVREMVTNGTESDRLSRLQFLANAHYNLIVAIGPGYAHALKIVATANPETQFALINDASVGNLNISDMIFSNTDGAYLAGVLAGAATKSKKVGFIAPTLFAPYVAAFVMGLKSVQPKATVVSQLVDADPVTATKNVVFAGADVIFSEWTSGGEVQDTISSLSTKKHPVYLIGVNPDQYFLLDKSGQKVVIGAVSKHVDIAVADVMNSALLGESIIDVLNGTDGIFGHMYTVKDGGESMALTALGSAYGVKVAAAVAQLKSGKIKLP